MAGTGDTAETALWARWRAHAGEAGAEAAPEPDALWLAAYAEGRLDETAAEPVERWLAEHPEALADLAAARAAAETLSTPVPETIIASAAVLVAVADPRVVLFRPPLRGRRDWRSVAAWSGLAASILTTSLIGFQLGSDAYLSLTNDDTVIESTQPQQELFDPQGSGILPSIEEDAAT